MDDKYYIYDNETQQGPITWADLISRRNSGLISPSAFMWKEGMTGRRPLNEMLPPAGLPRSPVSSALEASRPRGWQSSSPLRDGPRTSRLAIATLVLGGLGLLLSILTAIPAIIT